MTRYSRTMKEVLMEVRGLLDENAFKKLQFVAKDLAKLAAKDKKGMDYKDYMKAAAMMKTGKVKELKKFVNDLDTAPREVIIMRVAREMGNATAERIFNVRINEATGFPPTNVSPCPKCGNVWPSKCTCVVSESVELDEAKYDLYHKDFSSAMQHAYAMAKKLHGITIDPKEIDDKVATGPKKPSKGKTNSYRLKGKGGAIQVQVANLVDKKFELNMYKE